MGCGSQGETERRALNLFADALEYDFREVGGGANSGSVPEEFAFAFSGVAPGGVVFGEALLDSAFRFAEEDGDVLDGVEAVSNEEGDHHDVLGIGGGVAVGDVGGLLHEGGQDVDVVGARANGLDLGLDGFAGVPIFPGAVASDEKGGLVGAWGVGEGVLLDDVACL